MILDRPFCARVVPGELLGINPVKNEFKVDTSPESFYPNIQKNKSQHQKNIKNG